MVTGRRQSAHTRRADARPGRGGAAVPGRERPGLAVGGAEPDPTGRLEVVTHRGGAFDSQGLLSHDGATVPQGSASRAARPAPRVGCGPGEPVPIEMNGPRELDETEGRHARADALEQLALGGDRAPRGSTRRRG